MGFQCLELHLSAMKALKTSIHNMKRYGERASPCLIPLDGWKGSKAPPLNKMEMDKKETQLIIKVIGWLGILKRVRVSLIKLYSSRS